MTQNHYQVSISEVFLQESWSGGFRTGRPRRFGAVLGRKTIIRCLKCQKHHGSRRLLVYTLEEMALFPLEIATLSRIRRPKRPK